MAQQKKGPAPKVAPVDKYPERPLDEALADPEDIKAYENRPEKDQIEDYHEKHPTLKATKAHNAEPPHEEFGDPVL